jgi:signal transduction histidine kinase
VPEYESPADRTLHDGGQQRLVAHRLGGEIDAALDELRSLAAGVYPSLLAARGLPDALRTAALQSPVPTSVEIEGSDRYADEVETAAYFCCIEALQNVAKHAPDASSVAISVSRDGDLRFEVRDDGQGFAVDGATMGNGITNMRDRMGAVGGELQVQSSPGAGTAVIGTIPVSAR